MPSTRGPKRSSLRAMTSLPIPAAADIVAAADRIRPFAVRTPLVESPDLAVRTGARVFLKLEPLQRGGSFKFRGACNRIAAMSPAERARGVVAFSSGNHAQGIALAARLHATPALIVMPSDAPAVKIAGTRAAGGEIVFYDREHESREDIAHGLAAGRGATLVPSFDDPVVIAGQGTIGLEIAADLAAMGAAADRLVCCVGGGGLIGGKAVAMAEASPGTRIEGVEPSGFDDMARSIASGRPERNVCAGGSLQDALLTPEPSPLTLALARRHVAAMHEVTDGEAMEAARYAAGILKLVVEPGGAAALAAVLSGRVGPARGETLVVIVSGGNIDPAFLARALGGSGA